MVDFSSLGSTASGSNESDPRKIFNALVKPEGVNDLYASQGEVLEKWYISRASADRIIKLPTGGGKSLVGLLIAQSSLNELKQPSLYVVPTRQLVGQVVDEAARFGLKASPYLSSKEGIPGDVLDAKSIGVATYDAIFNGKSKFGTATKSSDIDQLGAIILDDAHAAFETVWDNFSFVIKSRDHTDLYSDICSRFRKSFSEIGKSFVYDDVVSGKDYYILEVPYWDWLERIPEIGAVLQAYDPANVNPFAWQHIRDEMHVCHALVSKDAFSIVPIVPFVDKVAAFSQARRRIYMSATIANDSEVVRTFGASAAAVGQPIVAASLAGVGERMILAPALTKLPTSVNERSLLHQLITSVRVANKNSLVLTPSFDVAKEWSSVGIAATKREESETLIARLKSERGLVVVVPRRYDGVDLPGEDCRLLVLDGLPYGSSDYDSWRITTLSQGIANSQLAQRVEQAIGRASRGTSDYCVVVLTGSALVHWLGRTTNQAFLSSSTRKQLEIGLNVSEAVSSAQEFITTAWQSLNRDAGWRSYHAQEMASAAIPSAPEQSALLVWEAERSGVEELRIRKFTPAINAFDAAIEKASDANTKGWFHQLKARAAAQAGDDSRSDEWQAKAYRLNMRLTPPRGQVQVSQMELPGQQAIMISSKLNDYIHGHVAIKVFDQEVSFLNPFSTSSQFEGGVEKLFSWLGFSSSRPDELFSQGPDNLIIDENGFAFIVEAKSRRKGKNKFTKTLHGQVLNHENWFNANYSPQQKRQRLVIAASAESEANAGTHDTLVVTFDALAALVADARSLLADCAAAPEEQRFSVASQGIADRKLTLMDILQRFVPFSDAA